MALFNTCITSPYSLRFASALILATFTFNVILNYTLNQCAEILCIIIYNLGV